MFPIAAAATARRITAGSVTVMSARSHCPFDPLPPGTIRPSRRRFMIEYPSAGRSIMIAIGLRDVLSAAEDAGG
jgi:hypothetical protein